MELSDDVLSDAYGYIGGAMIEWEKVKQKMKPYKLRSNKRDIKIIDSRIDKLHNFHKQLYEALKTKQASKKLLIDAFKTKLPVYQKPVEASKWYFTGRNKIRTIQPEFRQSILNVVQPVDVPPPLPPRNMKKASAPPLPPREIKETVSAPEFLSELKSVKLRPTKKDIERISKLSDVSERNLMSLLSPKIDARRKQLEQEEQPEESIEWT